MLEHEGQAVGRLAALAQALAGLAEAVVAEQGVEQRLAGTTSVGSSSRIVNMAVAFPMRRERQPSDAAPSRPIRDHSMMRWNQIPALRPG